MIIKEFYTTREDGVELYRSYSDKGLLIRKAGTEEIYSEAIDVSTASYEYEETDIPIDENSDELVSYDALAQVYKKGVDSIDQ